VGFPGQPSLTALAALRAGGDVAKALVSEAIYPAVAKSDVDVVVEDGEQMTNDVGSRVTTVVGTGDTLAGVIAALMVQVLARREAAELGAWIVGKAGELATVERWNGIVTTDAIEEIPRALR
jgi:NAD(P)H-hydrate repair Nnr-like enzyme with NAD(P)H-hydrate dehydratase domain